MSSDLWSFSLDLYARPGVEQACLTLQKAGASVCLLLCGLWLAQRGVACNERRLLQLQQLADTWDMEVIQPLRALRTQWKDRAQQDTELDSLREEIKKLELEAERQLLKRLEAATTDWPGGRPVDAEHWLQGWVASTDPSHGDALHLLRVAVSDPAV